MGIFSLPMDLVSYRFIVNNLIFSFYIFPHFIKILHTNYERRTLIETGYINIKLLYSFIQEPIHTIITCNMEYVI